ncbi:hypothetical protein RR48_13909 [Papilio machaon]|uniref:Uncharacterized protein n=1 Tax=Papilio machaon TaxID=76193 RepID=A0A194RGV7_PAPMA|nr:hypothetical protein RR48_13909 [Papilio machaon]
MSMWGARRGRWTLHGPGSLLHQLRDATDVRRAHRIDYCDYPPKRKKNKIKLQLRSGNSRHSSMLPSRRDGVTPPAYD